MTTNTVAVTTSFRGIVEFSIRCSFRKTQRKEPDRGLHIIADTRPLVRANMGSA